MAADPGYEGVFAVGGAWVVDFKVPYRLPDGTDIVVLPVFSSSEPARAMAATPGLAAEFRHDATAAEHLETLEDARAAGFTAVVYDLGVRNHVVPFPIDAAIAGMRSLLGT